MKEYRRWYVAGGTYFFTVVTHLRRRFLVEESSRSILHDVFVEARLRWPFEIPAIVLLPEHLHAIWTLPRADDDYPTRWAWIKKEFTKRWLESGGFDGPISVQRRKRKRRGVWRVRFWEHTIDSEHDFDRHFDYIHYNPVKHGHVDSPRDWPWSSFHRWVKAGVYNADWGRKNAGEMTFDDLALTAKE
jgi:putative transposase